MSMTFRLSDKKEVTVSDELANAFKKYMGYDLNQIEVEGYIDTYFMGDLDDDDDDGIPYEEAVEKFSEAELSEVLRKQINADLRYMHGYTGPDIK